MFANIFNDLDMDNKLTVLEMVRAVMAWEYDNKYYNGKSQVIELTNFNNEIYVAHNLFDELHVVDSWQYLKDIIYVLEQYADTEERKEYRNEFWTDRIRTVIEIQNL